MFKSTPKSSSLAGELNSHSWNKPCLVKEPKHFTTDILSPSLLMIHNASRCCQHYVSKLQVQAKNHKPSRISYLHTMKRNKGIK